METPTVATVIDRAFVVDLANGLANSLRKAAATYTEEARQIEALAGTVRQESAETPEVDTRESPTVTADAYAGTPGFLCITRKESGAYDLHFSWLAMAEEFNDRDRDLVNSLSDALSDWCEKQRAETGTPHRLRVKLTAISHDDSEDDDSEDND